MVHPQCKAVRESTVVNAQLTPIYPTTAGLTQPAVCKAIETVMRDAQLFEETLPASAYAALNLPTFASSIRALHSPEPDADLTALEQQSTPEWRRLAYDELLAQQLSMRKHYAKRRSIDAPQIAVSHTLVKQLLQDLPFALTTAQQKVIQEISQDLTQAHPMQRLLQGDVGVAKPSLLVWPPCKRLSMVGR